MLDRWKGWWKQLRSFLDPRAAERALDEELRFHIDMETERLVREGVPESEARRRAMVAFGGVERAKEQVRDARWTRAVDDLVRDLGGAIRSLRKSPGFTLAAVLALSLGIGTSTVVFGLVDASYLSALPFPERDRVVWLWQDHRLQGGPEEERFNPPDFERLRDDTRTLSAVAAISAWTPTLTGAGAPARLEGMSVSYEYFEPLGARPALGRLFTEADETSEGARVVVLARELWTSRFGADPTVIGRRIRLDGETYTVLGVTAEGFTPPTGDPDVWRPLRSGAGEGARMFRIYDVIGRLAPDTSLDDARLELATIARRVAEEHPTSNAGVTFRAARLADRVLGPVRPALVALLGAVGLLLAVACANVAGLLLARGAARAREMAVRSALGAGRGRLLRQLLVEGALLGALGGGLGVLAALGGIELIAGILPPDLLPGGDPQVTGWVVAATLGLSVVVVTTFALFPAVRVSAATPVEALVGDGRASSRSGAGLRGRSVLVIGEIALSLALIVGAAHLFRSFVTLLDVDPGFVAEGVVTAEVSLPGEAYPTPEAVRAFHEALVADLEARPGVRSAAATSFLPLRSGENDVSFVVQGLGPTTEAGRPLAWYRIVTPAYFRTMGIPVLQGRALSPSDGGDATGVVVVNETLAERHWPGGQAVGARLRPEWAQDGWLTVVGVVGAVRHRGLEVEPVPELYFPHAQMAGASRTMTWVVRTEGAPERAVPVLRDAVDALDPGLPLERVVPMDELLERSVAMPRIHLWTFASFGILALILAAIGLYGLVSTVVTQQTREIGVRMALGAKPGTVLMWISGYVGSLVGIGVLIGLLGATAVSGVVATVTYRISPWNPAVFMVAAALVALVALLAAVVPTRRAVSVDPARALRPDVP